jgi:hypothetical protein
MTASTSTYLICTQYLQNRLTRDIAESLILKKIKWLLADHKFCHLDCLVT